MVKRQSFARFGDLAPSISASISNDQPKGFTEMVRHRSLSPTAASSGPCNELLATSNSLGAARSPAKCWASLR